VCINDSEPVFQCGMVAVFARLSASSCAISRITFGDGRVCTVVVGKWATVFSCGVVVKRPNDIETLSLKTCTLTPSVFTSVLSVLLCCGLVVDDTIHLCLYRREILYVTPLSRSPAYFPYLNAPVTVSCTGCIVTHHLPTRTENISLLLEFSGPLVTNSRYLIECVKCPCSIPHDGVT